MKLQDQVVEFELSHKIGSLEIPQDSFWVWVQSKDIFGDSSEWILRPNCHDGEGISAFTVAELGEMLPDGFDTNHYSARKAGKWHCLGTVNHETKGFLGDTEANARAKMLIYLKENNLISGG